jgi:hypothetical protein
VTDIRRTAQGVFHDNNPEAEVDGVEHGGEHTNVSLRAGYHHRPHVFLNQQLAQPRTGERRIGRLVDDEGRRHMTGKCRHDIEIGRPESRSRRALPFPEIGLPLAGAVFGPLRRDKAGEHRPLPVAGRNVRDDRQHLFHPRRFPDAAFGENVLHIDTEMRGVEYLIHR